MTMKNSNDPSLKAGSGFFREVTVLTLAHLAVVVVLWLFSARGRALLSRLTRRFRGPSNVVDL